MELDDPQPPRPVVGGVVRVAGATRDGAVAGTAAGKVPGAVVAPPGCVCAVTAAR